MNIALKIALKRARDLGYPAANALLEGGAKLPEIADAFGCGIMVGGVHVHYTPEVLARDVDLALDRWVETRGVGVGAREAKPAPAAPKQPKTKDAKADAEGG